MASIPLPSAAPHAGLAADRRLAGILATVLVHAALVMVWQLTRTQPPAQQEEAALMQWVDLPPLVAATVPVPVPKAVETPRPGRPARAAQVPTAPAAPETAAAIVEEAAPEPAAAETPARPSAAAILENARRSVGSIDRALRKESKPLIVAPPDSPQLRMRHGMEQAHALAAPRLFEAPKVEELVNNTGDGARRTRVITGNRTYCITERSPATNVEMIEMHGKIRLTNCPAPETPAKRQEWRTARD
ncbi:hypothetical protein [Massilia sp. LjRoot122]|uniref:hypothetical protein n=1 Tax=Massilia sp. LjRoot122 TaxID=3342257 RepID=UPI003ED14CE7